jgi:sortase B
MKKWVRIVIIAILSLIFVYSLYQIIAYLREKDQNQQVTQQAEQYVETPEKGDDRITVDFDAMLAVNQDIKAWLYNPDSKINYPVVQSADNDYYLHRMLNGEYNANGTIFMDYTAAPDFSGQNTLIYGHNMRSGYMFGELTNYKKQAYYDEHPFMYLLTPSQDYRLELIAGAVVDDDDELYTGELTEGILSRLISASRFAGSYTVSDTGNFVTLSTCSYEYENARFVVVGQLVPMEP